ncbi:MAG: hypothetical protein AMXMBFR56_68220 [Polyangiaceae bacterium]
MLDVYGSISGQLGATEVEVAVVSGIQQLSPGLADDVLTLLNKRVMVPDSSIPVAKGVWNFIAVTMAQLAQLGYKTSEATQSAGTYIASLPAGNYALANVNDALNLKLGDESIFHFTVAEAAAVPVMAGPGSTLAVLSPLAGGAVTPAAKPEEKKFSIVTPLLGAGVGLLVGGPVGAAVGGGIGLGIEVLRAA